MGGCGRLVPVHLRKPTGTDKKETRWSYGKAESFEGMTRCPSCLHVYCRRMKIIGRVVYFALLKFYNFLCHSGLRKSRIHFVTVYFGLSFLFSPFISLHPPFLPTSSFS